MTNIPNGVRAETLENLEFEAGLILKKKFTTFENFNKDTDVLCATTGGIKVNITANKKQIVFDGIAENTVGTWRFLNWISSVQYTTKEVDKDNVVLALANASILTSGNVSTITLNQGIADTDKYQDFYILGKMADGTWRQVIIKNGMNDVGLTETRNDKGETEIAYDIKGNYTIDDQDTPPVSIEYITAQV